MIGGKEIDRKIEKKENKKMGTNEMRKEEKK